jgi:hypothetical protein
MSDKDYYKADPLSDDDDDIDDDHIDIWFIVLTIFLLGFGICAIATVDNKDSQIKTLQNTVQILQNKNTSLMKNCAESVK